MQPTSPSPAERDLGRGLSSKIVHYIVPVTYLKRGKIKYALNDLLGAFHDFKSAVETDPNAKSILSLKEKTENELIKFLESSPTMN